MLKDLAEAGVSVSRIVLNVEKVCMKSWKVSWKNLRVMSRCVINLQMRSVCVQNHTALHVLSKRGHVECVEFILTKDPDLLAEDAVRKRLPVDCLLNDTAPVCAAPPLKRLLTPVCVSERAHTSRVRCLLRPAGDR